MGDKLLTVKDLKPCPVEGCGRKVTILYGIGYTHVGCSQIDAGAVGGHQIEVYHEDKQTAFRRWNSMGRDDG